MAGALPLRVAPPALQRVLCSSSNAAAAAGAQACGATHWLPDTVAGLDTDQALHMSDRSASQLGASSSSCEGSDSTSRGGAPGSSCGLPLLQQWQHAWHSSYSGSLQSSFSQAGAVRGYAKKGGGKGKAPPPVIKKAPPEPNPYAPAVFKRPSKPSTDVVKSLPATQKALLQALVPDGKPLRSLRQIGWDLAPKDVLSLLHSTASTRLNKGQPLFIAPIIYQNFFQSAASVAHTVKMCMEDGISFLQVQQYFLQVLSAAPDPNVMGVKVQVKGRMSGKGGKASKKVWAWGKTSVQTFDDPVDYAEQAALTRAGYIGVKVWLIYKREAIGDNWFAHRNKTPLTLDSVLAMPRSTPVARSRSAWWAIPGPLQPVQFRAWEAFVPSYDPVSAGSTRAAAVAAAGEEVDEQRWSDNSSSFSNSGSSGGAMSSSSSSDSDG